jgi:hypothetical protein
MVSCWLTCNTGNGPTHTAVSLVIHNIPTCFCPGLVWPAAAAAATGVVLAVPFSGGSWCCQHFWPLGASLHGEGRDPRGLGGGGMFEWLQQAAREVEGGGRELAAWEVDGGEWGGAFEGLQGRLRREGDALRDKVLAPASLMRGWQHCC